MAKKQKAWKIVSLALRMAAVLLILIPMSARLWSGTFASYISSYTGSDSARVAKFHVEMVPQSVDAVTLDGTKTADSTLQGSYVFSVSSDSEVAVAYSIQIVFSTPPPVGVILQLDGQPLQASDGTATTFTFDGGEIAPNDLAPQQHELKITALRDSLDEAFSDTVSVQVSAEQIDEGGTP